MKLDDRTLRRIKLSDLRLFHVVAQCRGMAKAAAHLNISQPAVSKAIAALEHALGVRLLERNPQGVEPTVFGNALLRGGTAVFDELQQSLKQIEFLADPTVGELWIGCTEPLAAGFVPSVIGQLSRQYPGVCFHVVTGDPVTLTEQALRQRTIELAIAPTSRLNLGGEIAAEKLFDDRQVVMADAKSKWSRRRNLRLADLIHEPWLLPPLDSIIGVSILELFRANGLQPPRTQIVSFSIPLHHHLLVSGRFLIMFPISMAHLGKHLHLKILDVGISGISRPTAIMTLRKRSLSPLAQLFIAAVRKFAQPLAKAR
jgi:DNA-binding transcriptional LysR family regulator